MAGDGVEQDLHVGERSNEPTVEAVGGGVPCAQASAPPQELPAPAVHA